MHFERLKKAFEDSGLTHKKLAEKSQVSEKTILRMLTNPEYRASVETTTCVATALNITMFELFAETDVVLIKKEVLAELEEAKRFVEGCQTLSSENIALRETVSSLTKMNESLQEKLNHKEEIIGVHESYKFLLTDLARIINENHTDTQ